MTRAAAAKAAEDPSKQDAAYAALAEAARRDGTRMTTAGAAAPGVQVEVMMEDEGLKGSRYGAVVLEVRRAAAVGSAAAGFGASGASGGAACCGKKRKSVDAVEASAAAGREGEGVPAPAPASTPAPPMEALVEYDVLFGEDEEVVDDEESAAAEGTAEPGEACGQVATSGPLRLREWVPLATLRPPPPRAPDEGWQQQLVAGSAAELLFDGGWWDVTVVSRLPGNARLGEPTHWVVEGMAEAVGYAINHTVVAAALRPRAP